MYATRRADGEDLFLSRRPDGIISIDTNARTREDSARRAPLRRSEMDKREQASRRLVPLDKTFLRMFLLGLVLSLIAFPAASHAVVKIGRAHV